MVHHRDLSDQENKPVEERQVLPASSNATLSVKSDDQLFYNHNSNDNKINDIPSSSKQPGSTKSLTSAKRPLSSTASPSVNSTSIYEQPLSAVPASEANKGNKKSRKNKPPIMTEKKRGKAKVMGHKSITFSLRDPLARDLDQASIALINRRVQHTHGAQFLSQAAQENIRKLLHDTYSKMTISPPKRTSGESRNGVLDKKELSALTNVIRKSDKRLQNTIISAALPPMAFDPTLIAPKITTLKQSIKAQLREKVELQLKMYYGKVDNVKLKMLHQRVSDEANKYIDDAPLRASPYLTSVMNEYASSNNKHFSLYSQQLLKYPSSWVNSL